MLRRRDRVYHGEARWPGRIELVVRTFIRRSTIGDGILVLRSTVCRSRLRPGRSHGLRLAVGYPRKPTDGHADASGAHAADPYDDSLSFAGKQALRNAS